MGEYMGTVVVETPDSEGETPDSEDSDGGDRCVDA